MGHEKLLSPGLSTLRQTSVLRLTSELDAGAMPSEAYAAAEAPEYDSPLTSFVSEDHEAQRSEPKSFSDAPLPSQPAPTWGLGEPYEAAAPLIDVGASRAFEDDADTDVSQDPHGDPSMTTWASEAPDEKSDALEPTAESVPEPQLPAAYTPPMAAPDDEPAAHLDAVAATAVAAAVAADIVAPKKNKKKKRKRMARRA